MQRAIAVLSYELIKVRILLALREELPNDVVPRSSHLFPDSHAEFNAFAQDLPVSLCREDVEVEDGVCSRVLVGYKRTVPVTVYYKIGLGGLTEDDVVVLVDNI
ncbi:hypothetical protein CVT26_005217 [Gymnopilus dilepis]|uniref:Uncharacterized protein n=1 Tax=Gymnopilus dilepis TaxID=231916 RepID=A0A409YVJ9_9AGAR|nr:hypothetical protein CVT26_005217 [Gymnopilus dilepis]